MIRRRQDEAMPSDSTIDRRTFLHILAGAVCLATGTGVATAGEARIDRLITAARAYGKVSQRVDFISRALLGTPYRGYTLIGGPRRAEQFVVRDDAFDCVTYCETVLAAAIAANSGEFRQALRAIRYHNGVVDWRERNHYFYEWGQRNAARELCRPIAMDGSVALSKTVYWHKALGKRHFTMLAIPRATFLANKSLLAAGDIVGFVTRRPDLDYFHVGFVVFGGKGDLMLRHASQSRGRVIDERMDRFIALYGVRYVTLWRPREPHAVA
jgi:hypothetical protein